MPGSSELLLLYLLQQQSHEPWQLILVATFGNWIGAILSFALGRLLYLGIDRLPGLPRLHQALHSQKYQRAHQWVERWGSPVLLLSWVPIVGDPLVVVAGFLGVRWWQAVIWLGIGKAIRYGLLGLPFLW